ncbi:MAG: NAD(P)-dependent oxidoreductase [Pseudomonadota bacterium]
MTSALNIAFIGLGVMGAPMAGHLVRAGHRVTAFNRTEPRAVKWCEALSAEGFEASILPTPAQAAADADVVIICVGNDQDVASVTKGKNGALSSMRRESLLIDHTTTSADMARELGAACAKQGVAFVDAPVSGGQAGAESGQLAIMCGGSDEAMALAEAVMQAYAKAVIHVGPTGAGQTAKMANQMCIAGVLGGLCEAIRLAQGAGLDLDKTFEAISGGAAQSWQMDNRWATMTRDEFEFGFAIDWMRKDLGYALEEAKRLGLASPISALVDQFYADVQAKGGGRLDTSALITRLAKSNS